MHEIPSLITTVTLAPSPNDYSPSMTDIPHASSTQRPQTFLSRPHLKTHGISGTGFEEWEIRITCLEFYVLLLSTTVTVLFLAWLALVGLDYLRPQYRGQARLSEKVLRYLKLKAERLKDKDEDEDTWVELEECSNTTGRVSVTGQTEDEDTEKGESTGEQLGRNEPRRRN
ncbi:hypothetical protein V501_03965 [Pseudogymnoascus sp. VKM F-4519 (FW-2642)]|nr:hypothetical protein V501_03965 [Pseudogymnoascus sp. VKM F-4519 (FW-2642)]